MTIINIKIFALFCMILDHIDKAFNIGELGDLFGYIGRLAFPLFAFATSEGVKKTHNIKKYIRNLFLFAVISEPFFDMTLNIFNYSRLYSESLDSIILVDNGAQNVILTLLLGVLSISGYELFKNKKSYILKFLPFLLFILIAERFKTDYRAFGVILIFSLYFCRTKITKSIILLIWSTILYLGYVSWNGTSFMWIDNNFYIIQWIFSCLCIIPILLYNNKTSNKKMKWIFYIAYPLHLFILATIREILIYLR